MKRTSPKIDDAVDRSVDFEVTLMDLIKRSERRAWYVAASAAVLATILASGYFYVLPLKEKVPYLVMADAYTGTSTIARLTEDLAHRKLSSSEAINRSNVAHFIMARESYDLAMMNLRDWATVLTMSSTNVAAPYRALHSVQNDSSPYQIYGRDRAIRIKILSITLIGNEAGNETPRGATVRFQRSVYNKATGATQPLDSKIATLGFTYNANLMMDEEHRVENPLGFQVTSYRVDTDFATPAPAATSDSPATDSAKGSPGPDVSFSAESASPHAQDTHP